MWGSLQRPPLLLLPPRMQKTTACCTTPRFQMPLPRPGPRSSLGRICLHQIRISLPGPPPHPGPGSPPWPMSPHLSASPPWLLPPRSVLGLLMPARWLGEAGLPPHRGGPLDLLMLGRWRGEESLPSQGVWERQTPLPVLGRSQP